MSTRFVRAFGHLETSKLDYETSRKMRRRSSSRQHAMVEIKSTSIAVSLKKCELIYSWNGGSDRNYHYAQIEYSPLFEYLTNFCRHFGRISRQNVNLYNMKLV
jgi:hypothetical protein